MNKMLFLSILLSCCLHSIAQTKQFSVVKPDGSTQVYATFNQSIAASVDGDAIYLPAGFIAVEENIRISKKIKLIGVGINPLENGNLGITEMPTSSSVQMDSSIELVNIKFNSCTILGNLYAKNCYFNYLYVIQGSNFLIENCWINLIGTDCNTVTGGLIKNSIINNGIQGAKQLKLSNCIFLSGPQYNYHMSLIDCSFTNCIFLELFSTNNSAGCTTNGLSFFNCLFLKNEQAIPSNSNISFSPNNFWGGTLEQTFQNPLRSIEYFIFFNFENNFKLKGNSQYLNAGIDGGQIGIYGGNSPMKEGNTPGNPYIYHKKVEPNSTPDGKLKVEYKVRTGN
jgi:hypothetical protein